MREVIAGGFSNRLKAALPRDDLVTPIFPHPKNQHRTRPTKGSRLRNILAQKSGIIGNRGILITHQLVRDEIHQLCGLRIRVHVPNSSCNISPRRGFAGAGRAFRFGGGNAFSFGAFMAFGWNTTGSTRPHLVLRVHLMPAGIL